MGNARVDAIHLYQSPASARVGYDAPQRIRSMYASLEHRERSHAIRAIVLRMLVCSIVVIGAHGTAFGQEADTVALPMWNAQLAAKLSASQASFHNWTEGGVNSLASTALLDGTFERKSVAWKQTYETRLSFGVVKQDALELRKSEDQIRLRATVNYEGDGFLRQFRPTVSATIRTQFAPGFNYDKNPFENYLSGLEPPVKVSDFFSPAIFTQSMGLEYSSDWGFKQRLGIGAKETVVLLSRFRELYGLRESETIRFQVGVESFTEVDREVFKNVRLRSALGLFAAFNQEELPDMLWENVIIMKVNSWLSADLEFVSMFDRDISNAIQIKEALSVGISVAII